MDTVFYENFRKKLTIGDYIVAFYIIAIFVFENEKYGMLFSIIQLLFFGYLAWMVFKTKKFPVNVATQWIIIVALLVMLYFCVGANKYVDSESFLVAKNLLKAICIAYYLYTKDNKEIIIIATAIAGIICGGFIIINYLENPITSMELKYAFNSRVGAEIAGGNVNVVAMNMCFSFASCMYLAKDSLKKSKKVFWYLALVFITISSFFTGTRKILLVFVVMFFLANRNIKIRYKIMGLIAAIVAYLILMNVDTFYFLLGHKIDFFRSNSYKMYDHSDQIRHDLLIQSWELFKNRPWGSGFGCVQAALGVYAHNNYMEVLASLGLVGFIVYYSVYIWELCKSYSYRKDNSCHFCFYTLVGIMILEIGQITCYYSMIYVFVPLIEYIIRYKGKKREGFL